MGYLTEMWPQVSLIGTLVVPLSAGAGPQLGHSSRLQDGLLIAAQALHAHTPVSKVRRSSKVSTSASLLKSRGSPSLADALT